MTPVVAGAQAEQRRLLERPGKDKLETFRGLLDRAGDQLSRYRHQTPIGALVCGGRNVPWYGRFRCEVD